MAVRDSLTCSGLQQPHQLGRDLQVGDIHHLPPRQLLPQDRDGPLAVLVPAPARTGAQGWGHSSTGCTCITPVLPPVPHIFTCFILSFSSSARRRASSFLCKQSSQAESHQRKGDPEASRHPGLPLTPPQYQQGFHPKKALPIPNGTRRS